MTTLSKEDLATLREKFKKAKGEWAIFSTDERWRYHAYDYGWRRFYYNDHSHSYALDENGKWYDPKLAYEAERLYRGQQREKKPKLNTWEPGYHKRYDEPWFKALTPEKQSLFKEQDLDRFDMHKRLKAGDATEQEWLDLCRQQAEQNLASAGKPKSNQPLSDPEIEDRIQTTVTRHRSATQAAASRAGRPDLAPPPQTKDYLDQALSRVRQAFGLPPEKPSEP